MAFLRRRGFTLIELLVVIAIIGILAAMLFPVFARARESARKTQCLANVKNIAIAFQMYFTDYDKGPPWENRQEIRDFYYDNPGGGDTWGQAADPPTDCNPMSDHSNPYLRDPVILDDYTKNRDIWRCPSAKLQGGAMVIYGNPNWFAEVVQYNGDWGDGKTVCIKDGCYPNGWGGSVTDSFVQQQVANTYWGGSGSREGAQGTFVQSIGTNMNWHTLSTSAMGDASSFVVCHDAGNTTDYDSPGTAAYPDLCAAECDSEWCAWADWANCASTCGDFIYSLPPKGGEFAKNLERLKTYTRHLGGINLGFADGHAKWMLSRAFVDDCIKQGKEGIEQPFGMSPWSGGYPTWCTTWDSGIKRFYSP